MLLQRDDPFPWCSRGTSARVHICSWCHQLAAGTPTPWPGCQPNTQPRAVGLSSFPSCASSNSSYFIAVLLFFWEGTEKPETVWQLYTLHFRKTSPSSSCHLTQAGTSRQLYHQPSSTSPKVGGFADSLSLNTADFPAVPALTDRNTSLSYW